MQFVIDFLLPMSGALKFQSVSVGARCNKDESTCLRESGSMDFKVSARTHLCVRRPSTLYNFRQVTFSRKHFPQKFLVFGR